MAINFEIEGMKELVDAVERLGALPQKCVTGAARKGANVVLKAARAKAPKKSGALRKGIKLKKERSRTKGKAVFDVAMDPKKNDLFVKEANGKRYYYPASMEYGFKLRGGGKREGFHFLKSSADENTNQVERTMIEELARRVDVEWGKR